MSFVNKVCKMRDFYQSLGQLDEERTSKMATYFDELMESKGDSGPQMRPEDFSFLEIFEAVPPSAFPILTGKVLSNKVMQAYQTAPTIHENLVETLPSKMQIDRIPGAGRTGSLKQVNPGQNYQHTGFVEEKWVQVEGAKYGEILDLTEEIIMFDQVGLVLRRAGQIGEDAKMFKERQIVNGVQDIAGYKCWYPNNTAETVANADLYQNAQGAGDVHEYDNLVTNALTDIDDIDDARYLLSMAKDDKGDPIVVNPRQLLVPAKLELLAHRLINGPTIKGQYNHEKNPFQGAFQVIASPLLDVNSVTAWYLGDFKRQFVWKEVIPIQVLTRTDTKNDAAWERDIKAQYKIRLYGTCGATDYRHVVKSDGTV